MEIQAIYGQHIVSDGDDPYQNTVSVFPAKIDFTGSTGRFAVTEDDETIIYVRYEPIIHMRTVFTGEKSYQNSCLHYFRMTENFKQYTDQSLLATIPFKNMGIMFDQTRYLNRFQADTRYLVYLDIVVDEELIESFEEDLNAYASPAFTTLLTTRVIEGFING
jgi:hypothetical protein